MTNTNANAEPTHVSNILAVFMQQLVAKSCHSELVSESQK